ncbi:MAG TPA: RNA polymerase sigma-70 factor [Longimicrobium sp.]
MSADDPEILARVQQGDDAAFAEVFRAHYAPLVVAADRLLGDRAAAEDVAQEAMLELWRRREALPADTRVRAYLYQSVRNRALNHIRHLRVARRAEPDVPLPAPFAPADAEALTSELDSAMKAAVRGLPDDLRETFQMSRVDGLTYAEIARTLGVSVKTVEARMGRALRSLRDQLAPWLPPGGGW